MQYVVVKNTTAKIAMGSMGLDIANNKSTIIVAVKIILPEALPGTKCCFNINRNKVKMQRL